MKIIITYYIRNISSPSFLVSVYSVQKCIPFCIKYFDFPELVIHLLLACMKLSTLFHEYWRVYFTYIYTIFFTFLPHCILSQCILHFWWLRRWYFHKNSHQKFMSWFLIFSVVLFNSDLIIAILFPLEIENQMICISTKSK